MCKFEIRLLNLNFQYMAGIFHTGEVSSLVEVSVTEQILQKFPNSEELNMHKQCEPGSLFPTHALDFVSAFWWCRKESN